ncbi:MAG: hypothetical protein ABTR07_08355 [Candidatus Competibacter denitrificans]
MIFADLLADHKAQLGKTVSRFTSPDDADFKRHLRRAGQRMALKDPRWVVTEIPLTVGLDLYPAPADFQATPLCEWGRQGCGCRPQPWEEGFIGFPPTLITEPGTSGMQWRLSALPTAAMMGVWGPMLRVRYLAAHEISEAKVTVAPGSEGLVLLAALIEAMRELATDMTVIQLQKGLTGLPTAGTPAYLYERLCLEFSQT